MSLEQLAMQQVSTEQLISQLPSCGLFIAAAGFEDRSLAVMENVVGLGHRPFLLIHYEFGPEENECAFERVQRILQPSSPFVVNFDLAKLHSFEKHFAEQLTALAPVVGNVWLDISGLPTYGICMILRVLREHIPMARIRILYTEAKDYFPTEAEYQKFSNRHGGKGLERLPDSLSSETGDNLILESFAGFSIRHEQTCLFLFAGYEKHRSLGAIESMNPSKLVIIYGIPSEERLLWRLEMSKELHETLVVEVERAEEEAPALGVRENLHLLTTYYEMLYDDYRICIVPINSKIQAVAAFLAWERYPDIQLSFPLPVAYVAKRFSSGVGATFATLLPRSPGIEALYGAGTELINS